MVIGILGRKVGMTQVYDSSGAVVPVTVIQAGPCDVLQVKTAKHDGYDAVQLGFLDKPRRLASRSERGHVAALDSKRARRRSSAGAETAVKANCEPKRLIREFRGAADGIQIGQQVHVGVFHPELQKLADKLNEENGAKPGDEKYVSLANAEGRKAVAEKYPEDYQKAIGQLIGAVDVTGISKGRGFTGAMVRHNMAGQRASHGVKKVHRHMGSFGRGSTFRHPAKGTRMPGHHGAAQRTARNLKVVRVDLENDLLLVRGGVPGPNGGYLIVKQTNKVG
jgi:large subunit ribosomal protein L3